MTYEHDFLTFRPIKLWQMMQRYENGLPLPTDIDPALSVEMDEIASLVRINRYDDAAKRALGCRWHLSSAFVEWTRSQPETNPEFGSEMMAGLVVYSDYPDRPRIDDPIRALDAARKALDDGNIPAAYVAMCDVIDACVLCARDAGQPPFGEPPTLSEADAAGCQSA